MDAEMPEMRTCAWCQRPIFPRRKDALYCWTTSRCRTAAHRARKRARAQAAGDRLAALRTALRRVTGLIEEDL